MDWKKLIFPRTKCNLEVIDNTTIWSTTHKGLDWAHYMNVFKDDFRSSVTSISKEVLVLGTVSYKPNSIISWKGQREERPPYIMPLCKYHPSCFWVIDFSFGVSSWSRSWYITPTDKFLFHKKVPFWAWIASKIDFCTFPLHWISISVPIYPKYHYGRMVAKSLILCSPNSNPNLK